MTSTSLRVTQFDRTKKVEVQNFKLRREMPIALLAVRAEGCPNDEQAPYDVAGHTLNKVVSVGGRGNEDWISGTTRRIKNLKFDVDKSRDPTVQSKFKLRLKFQTPTVRILEGVQRSLLVVHWSRAQ